MLGVEFLELCAKDPVAAKIAVSATPELANFKSKAGMTPISVVLQQERPDAELLKLLISWANPSDCDQALDTLCKQNAPDMDLLKLLITRTSPAGRNQALITICKQNVPDMEVLNLLLSAKADIETYCGEAELTPLLLLCQQDEPNIQAVYRLLEAGANTEGHNKNKATALTVASSKAPLNTELILLLIKAEADINADCEDAPNNCRSFIRNLAQYGDSKLMSSLKDVGIDPHQLYVHWSATMTIPFLFLAVDFDNVDVVTWLLTDNNGAGVNVRVEGDSSDDLVGETPLFAARSMQVVDLLIKAGADVNARDREGNTPLFRFRLHGEMGDALIAAGADINIRNKQGMTPLHEYAAYFSPLALSWCLQNRLDINVKDNNGWTPLHYAVSWGKVDNVRYLLQNGAHVDERDREGITPLILCAASGFLSDEEKNDIFKILVEYGGDIDQRIKVSEYGWCGLGDLVIGARKSLFWYDHVEKRWYISTNH